MENFKGTLPPLSFAEDPQVSVDNTDMRLYDADTLKDDSTGESYRIKGLDAPEMPKVNPLEGFTKGLFAEDYRDEELPRKKRSYYW